MPDYFPDLRQRPALAATPQDLVELGVGGRLRVLPADAVPGEDAADGLGRDGMMLADALELVMRGAA